MSVFGKRLVRKEKTNGSKSSRSCEKRLIVTQACIRGEFQLVNITWRVT